MNRDAVTIAYVHPNEIAHSWHQSLMALIGYDLGAHGRVARGGWLAVRCYGADGIPGARNLAIKQFLSEKDAEWLFWVDTDMGFAPDTVDRLLAIADPVKAPIVGALCFAQKHSNPDGYGGWRSELAPTIFDWATKKKETGFLSRSEYPINSLVRCAGTGSACILIHRSVFVDMQEKYGDDCWYERVVNPTAGNKLMGEDLSFCLRAGAMDLPVYVHTGIRTTHFKPVWLGEQDYWYHTSAIPATQETAIVVPVMRRPQNARPFMESLRASTGLAQVYVMADVEDRETVDAWNAEGATVLAHRYGGPGTKRPGTFAEKMNRGYSRTKEPWIFAVGDDVRFHAGWLDHAQAVAGDQFHVIGTNDLGNPRVMLGEHGTHLLIRRSYVDEQGASWDGPKVVAHEGYRHWFVDDEIVTAAKQRGAWGMAIGSIVEHLHPMWNKGESDEVYEAGAASSSEDSELFRQRLAENKGQASSHAP